MYTLLQKLRRATTQYGLAPHKPVLLLAVVEAFARGEIVGNCIKPSDTLLMHFHDIWRQVVTTKNVPNFSLPFFHLSHEPAKFWVLITYPGQKIPTTKKNSIKSMRALRESVFCAKLSPALYAMLCNPVQRAKIQQLLLNTYFSGANLQMNRSTFSHDLSMQILANQSTHPNKQLLLFETDNEAIKKQLHEQEIVLRSAIFRRTVLEVYHERCAISGMMPPPEQQLNTNQFLKCNFNQAHIV